MEQLENKLKQIIKDKETLERLNMQLINIMKNRANAKRGITPKKKHDGYLVIRSEQFDYIYHSNKYKRDTLCLWRSTIQTPIDIGINIADVKDIIVESVIRKFKMIKSNKLSGCLNENIKLVKSKEWDNTLYLLDVKFRQNTKLRLWEMIIIHNIAIKITEDMCM